MAPRKRLRALLALAFANTLSELIFAGQQGCSPYGWRWNEVIQLMQFVERTQDSDDFFQPDTAFAALKALHCTDVYARLFGKFGLLKPFIDAGQCKPFANHHGYGFVAHSDVYHNSVYMQYRGGIPPL